MVNTDHNKRQVILGTVPSKSNCMKIITFKNKDKSKEHSSLGKTKVLQDYEKSFYLQCNKYLDKVNPRIEFFLKTV